LREKAAKYGLYRIYQGVSTFRKTATFARKCEKSPAIFGNIPVFGRLFAETDFDPHWVVEVAVNFSLCSRILEQFATVSTQRVGVGSQVF